MLNHKYNQLFYKRTNNSNNIKNISLNVEEKNEQPTNVVEELKVESNTNKVVTIDYNVLNLESSESRYKF